MKSIPIFAFCLLIFCCAAEDDDSMLARDGEVYEKTDKVYVCRSDEQVSWITSLITSHVMTGKISLWDALSVQNSAYDEQPAKMQAILREKGLPLIPPCIDATTQAATTEATVVETTKGESLKKTSSDEELSCSDPEYRRLAVEEVYESIVKNNVEKTEKLEKTIDSFLENNITVVLFKEFLKPFNLVLDKKCTLMEDASNGNVSTQVEQSDKTNEPEIRNETQTTEPVSESKPESSKPEVKPEAEPEVKPEDESKDVPPPSKPFDPSTLNMTVEEMEEGFEMVRKAMKMGIIPNDTLLKLAANEIHPKVVMDALLGNREFIIQSMPPPLQEFARNGSIAEKYMDLFTSGKVRSQIEAILVKDDNFFFQFFPKLFIDALAGQPLPMWFKRMMLSATEITDVTDALFKNSTNCEGLWPADTCAFLKLYSDQINIDLSEALDRLIIVALTLVMVAMGLCIDFERFMLFARRPTGVSISFVAQFIFMPAAALALVKCFQLDLYKSLTILVIGCSPGGILSNILSYYYGGDVNLSILMTCCSCLFGAFMMPLNIFIWARFIDENAEAVFPYSKITVNILITLLPVAFGFFIRKYFSAYVKIIKKVTYILLILISLVVFGVGIYLFADILWNHFPSMMVLACTILPLMGFIFGYLSSQVLGQTKKDSRTIMIETGVQNSQLSLAVLKLSFNPILMGVNIIVPFLYMIIQVLEIVFMIGIWNYFHKPKEDDDSDSFEKERTAAKLITEKADLESGIPLVNRTLN